MEWTSSPVPVVGALVVVLIVSSIITYLAIGRRRTSTPTRRAKPSKLQPVRLERGKKKGVPAKRRKDGKPAAAAPKSGTKAASGQEANAESSTDAVSGTSGTSEAMSAAVVGKVVAAAVVEQNAVEEQNGTASGAPEEPSLRSTESESSEDVSTPELEADSLMSEMEVVYKAEKMEQLPQEVESGNVEYKLKLSPENEDRFQQLVSQLQFRLSEGRGEALYEIGVEDDGTPCGIALRDVRTSIATLQRMASELGASCAVLRVRNGSGGVPPSPPVPRGSPGTRARSSHALPEVSGAAESGLCAPDTYRTAEVLVRRLSDGDEFQEIRIATIGNVDSGKSTTIGVLSKGQLDDGRGRARLHLFRHKHEMEYGRTSDVGREILGFDSKGGVVNYSSIRTPSWEEICSGASKVVQFIDLAGHEPYLRTTVFGLTGNFPDYSMLLMAANVGVMMMTKEHFHLTLALKVPSFVVITKVDIAPENVLQESLRTLKKMLKAPGSKKMPLFIKGADDVLTAARNINSGRVTPVFLVSNVTGQGLDLLRAFLNLLPGKVNWEEKANEPPVLHVDNTFTVNGVGTVVSGTLLRGRIQLNDTLLLGPDGTGQFNPTTIKGIHTSRLPVKSARAGQSVSLALKKVKRSQTRKGQVVIHPSYEPKSIWEFDAEIFVITHSTTIGNKYEAVVHCGCARQTAQIVGLDGVLRSGVTAVVRFRFKYKPEFVEPGGRLIFREGRTKGIGNIVRVIKDPSEELGAAPLRPKSS